MTHAIERTSPKSEPFVGYCTLCGKVGQPMAAALQPCPNPRGVTQDEAVLDAIRGPKEQP
jgi:hypothetical protein